MEFKLYVIGASANPQEWSEFRPRKFILARSQEEALALDEFSTTAVEVTTSEAVVIAEYVPLDN